MCKDVVNNVIEAWLKKYFGLIDLHLVDINDLLRIFLTLDYARVAEVIDGLSMIIFAA